jgi:hypothetical protein
MKKFTWLKILNSPFKLPKLRWYFGKIAVGVPYFFPRKTVKSKTKPGYLEFKPLKIGFSSCGLGWKTKWEDTDYRYEWSPVLSFVFFRWQIACWPAVEHPDNYWTAWLCYERNTDKTKSTKERIKQCRELFPNIWRVHEKDSEYTVDYYNLILKRKYL